MTKFARNVYFGSTNRPERSDFSNVENQLLLIKHNIIFEFLIVQLKTVVGKICMSKIGLTVPI